MAEETFDLWFESRRGAIVEPAWIAEQYKRLKPDDAGTAFTLIADDFPHRLGVVSFDVPKKKSVGLRFAEDARALPRAVLGLPKLANPSTKG